MVHRGNVDCMVNRLSWPPPPSARITWRAVRRRPLLATITSKETWRRADILTVTIELWSTWRLYDPTRVCCDLCQCPARSTTAQGTLWLPDRCKEARAWLRDWSFSRVCCPWRLQCSWEFLSMAFRRIMVMNGRSSICEGAIRQLRPDNVDLGTFPFQSWPQIGTFRTNYE